MPAALFTSASAITKQPVWGVFSVQAVLSDKQNPDMEEKYGKTIVDESVKQNVKHLVYSSVDRGGDQLSWSNPTDVPHFITKHHIEQHLKEKAGNKMSWTILRPVAFMENLQPGFPTKVFMAAWRDTLKDKKLQLVSTHDIGFFGAKAFLEPEAYNGKAVGLAGDDLNRDELEAIMRKKTGKEIGATFGIFGSAFMYFVSDLGKMMKWFKTDGYGVDIAKVRQTHQGLMGFERWLETRGTFELKK